LQNMAQDMVINSWMDACRGTFYSTDDHPLLLPPGLPRIPLDFYEKTGETDPSWEHVYRFLKTDEPTVLGDFAEGLKENFRSGGSQEQKEKPEPARTPFQPTDEGAEIEGEMSLTGGDGQPLPTGVHRMEDASASVRIRKNVREALKLSGQDFKARDERLVQEISALIQQVAKVDTAPLKRKIRTIIARGTPSREWEYSAARFNRRYFTEGIYTPGRHYVDKKLLTVVVDLSASMVTRPEHIEEAFGAVESLLDGYRINLLCIDETLFVPEKQGERFVKGGHDVHLCTYQRGDWRLIRSGNSGTTFFSPLFNGYLKNHQEMVVVITDGEIYDMERLAPYHRTLWLLPSNAQVFHPPFGEVVRLERERSG
ncbi:hypothetical protein, partial [Desulfoluna sp.]|uniref:hypothetical protein n=1 Tax=Desulfoluna sp. TaxID=2045199 RepID=UPI002626FDAB